MIVIRLALFWLKNSSFAALGLGSIAIVGMLWGVTLHYEHKGAVAEQAKQVERDEKAVVRAEKARKQVKKARKSGKSDGFSRD